MQTRPGCAPTCPVKALRYYSQLRDARHRSLARLRMSLCTRRWLGSVRPGQLVTQDSSSLLIMVKGDIFRADFALHHWDVNYLVIIHSTEAPLTSDLLRSAGRYNKVFEVSHMIS
jgi:hypothetical protein